jgi:formylglycine-generating enzyme required for sulfatase activity
VFSYFSTSAQRLPTVSQKVLGTFRDFDHAPEMIEIQPGSFLMGAPGHEIGTWEAEQPQHRVNIEYRFAIGKFPITFDEWDFFAADARFKGELDDQGWGRGRQPAINVSFDDTKHYVKWLSQRAGRQYRLLSEAEWEYACRAGTRTPFSTGETISADQANYNGNMIYGTGRKGVYRAKPIAVGSFIPNAFGVHDMHGNVLEWVQDCWNEDYQGAPAGGSAWLKGDRSLRVIRGGSWFLGPNQLRSAARTCESLDKRAFSYSFRVACTLP